jgi:hypothetical protein
MKVNVEIDKLVLHGFNISDQKIISATIETELSRLLKEDGLWQKGAENQKPIMLNVGSLTLKTTANPKAIGSQVALAIRKTATQ